MLTDFSPSDVQVTVQDPGFVVGGSDLGSAVLGVGAAPATTYTHEVGSVQISRGRDLDGFHTTYTNVSCQLTLKSQDTPVVIQGKLVTVWFQNRVVFEGIASYDKRSCALDLSKPDQNFKKWTVSSALADPWAVFANTTVVCASMPKARADQYITDRVAAIRQVIIDDSVLHEYRTFQLPATPATQEAKTAKEVIEDVERLLRCTAYLQDSTTLVLRRPGSLTMALADHQKPSYNSLSLTRDNTFVTSVTGAPCAWDKPEPVEEPEAIPLPGDPPAAPATPDPVESDAYGGTLSVWNPETHEYTLAFREPPVPRSESYTVAVPWNAYSIRAWVAAQPRRTLAVEYPDSVAFPWHPDIDMSQDPDMLELWLDGYRYDTPVLELEYTIETDGIQCSATLAPPWVLEDWSTGLRPEFNVTLDGTDLTWEVPEGCARVATRRFTDSPGEWAEHHYDGFSVPTLPDDPNHAYLVAGHTYNLTLWGCNSSGHPLTPPYTLEVTT